MKTLSLAFLMTSMAIAACNNEGTNTTPGSDTANRETTAPSTADTSSMANTNTSTKRTADPASSEFLMKAADGGMAEVDAGKMGQEKGMNESVKMFAGMMVNDHTGANAQVKSLASDLDVTLPSEPSADKKQAAMKLGQKSGKDFDRGFMDMMVKDHKATISLFEKAENDVKDEQVKSFITNTLPKLKTHLDSAQAISKRIK